MYEVKITANSLSELGGKLLTMATALAAIPADTPVPEVKSPAPRTKAPPKAEPQQVAEQVAEPVAEKTPEPQPEPAAEPAKVRVLDFDLEVAPVVVSAVKKRGKEWVQSILARYGVERASQVPDELFGELVEQIKAGLE